MARRTRIDGPPTTITDPATYDYLQKLADEVNKLPNTSIESYTLGPQSVHTGNPGDLLINIAGEEGTLYQKLSGTNTTETWKNLGGADAFGMINVTDPGPGEQTIATGAGTVLEFGSVVDDDSYAIAVGDITISATVGVFDGFIIGSTGTYELGFSSSFTGDVNSTWKAHLYESSPTPSELTYGWHRKIGASSDVGSATWDHGVHYATAGDVLHIRVSHDQGGNKGFSLIDGIFHITKLQ